MDSLALRLRGLISIFLVVIIQHQALVILILLLIFIFLGPRSPLWLGRDSIIVQRAQVEQLVQVVILSDTLLEVLVGNADLLVLLSVMTRFFNDLRDDELGASRHGHGSLRAHSLGESKCSQIAHRATDRHSQSALNLRRDLLDSGRAVLDG